MISLLVWSLHRLGHTHKIEQDINRKSCKNNVLERKENHVGFRKVKSAVVSATEASVGNYQKHYCVPGRQETVLGRQEEVIFALFLVSKLLLLLFLLLLGSVVVIRLFALVQQSFLFPLETNDKLDWIATYYMTVRMSSVPYMSIERRLRSNSFTRFKSFIIAVFLIAPASN